MAIAFKHIISNSVENMLDNICDFAESQGWNRCGRNISPPSIPLPYVVSGKEYKINFEIVKFSKRSISYVAPTAENKIIADCKMVLTAIDVAGTKFTREYTCHEDSNSKIYTPTGLDKFEFKSDKPFVIWSLSIETNIQNPKNIRTYINSSCICASRIKVSTDGYNFEMKKNSYDDRFKGFQTDYWNIDGLGTCYVVTNYESSWYTTNIAQNYYYSDTSTFTKNNTNYLFHPSYYNYSSGEKLYEINISWLKNFNDTKLGRGITFANCWVKIEDDILACTIQVDTDTYKHFLIGRKVYNGDKDITVDWGTASTLTRYVNMDPNTTNYFQFMFGTWYGVGTGFTGINAAVVDNEIHSITPNLKTGKFLIGGESWQGTGIIAQYARADISNQVLFSKILFGVNDDLHNGLNHWVGSVPIFHIMNMQDIEPAQRVTAGKRTFICFPMTCKTGTGDSVSSSKSDIKGRYGTGNGGFAIEIENEVV